jgi:predicted AlkP superfamily pyrophosphatase or phosphodiesterase
LEAAEALMDGEHLGQGPGTDLLALSFSATDYIGHAYGQLGTEMRDQIHRLDQLLDRLLDRLRRQHPGAWVVLSADHGGMDVVEVLKDRGFPAQRLKPVPFLAALQTHLRSHFKVDHNLLRTPAEVNTLYLDDAAITAAHLDRGAVLKQAQMWVRAQPEVADAFTAEELRATDPTMSGSPRATSLRLLIAVKPWVNIGTPPGDYLTNHGTPNAYERRVPLIFWGPWRQASRREPVRTVDLAPTLAHELGLKPGAVDGQVLDLGPRP